MSLLGHSDNRRAERKWKKNKLQVFYEILRHFPNKYQETTEASRPDFYSCQ